MLFKFKFLFRKKKNRKIDMYDISDEDLSSIILKGAIIVDVRSPQEYEEGHMEGAILLPEYDIKKKAREVLQDKNKDIVVYCSSGTRSKKAQEELNDMGYMKVYNLYNGFQNYWDFINFMLKFFHNNSNRGKYETRKYKKF